MRVLGIDVGGSGVKAAPVDVKTGEFTSERHRIETPRPATPDALAAVVKELVAHFRWKGPIGCGVPGVVKTGVMKTAANLHPSLVDCDVARTFSDAAGLPVYALNDADAAGLGEMRFGAGKDCPGTVIVVTLGTGIGTGLFSDGRLVPNAELGHIEIRGEDAEGRAAASVREKEDLSWKRYAKRLDEYLHALCRLLWPERVILGGGISKKHEKFVPRLTVDCDVVPAALRNQAGIVGAAVAAAENLPRPRRRKKLPSA